MSGTYKWRELTFSNDRGLNLAGLLYTGPEPGTIVIVCHGFTGSKEGGGKALVMAEELGERGYSTLLFDFSGCGESEGSFSDISLSGHINDVKCSVDLCLDLGYKSIIIVGRSFGGSAVLCLGGTDKRTAGVSCWSAPAEPFKLFSERLKVDPAHENGLVPLSGQSGTVLVKNSFFEDLKIHNAARCASLISPRPLLVVHGEADDVVPLSNAENIYKAAGGPKTIKIISGADHQFSGHYHEVWSAFFNWLENYFPV
ncbi:alpha/beta hydrolase [Pelotomaculum propionicicum]|uniref:alpha/beta hydrolase n=1 Tax=Pelotomaculum propionicicum TaxID=258475 RepID=UPI003B804769